MFLLIFVKKNPRIYSEITTYFSQELIGNSNVNIITNNEINFIDMLVLSIFFMFDEIIILFKKITISY